MSTAAPALAAKDSPTQNVLEHFLDDAMAASIEDGDHAQEERELRIDILYLLTDEKAHRRALPFGSLAQELRRIQAPGRNPSSISDTRIRTTLNTLLGQRLIRDFVSPNNNYYELAHDFLVRSVVRRYQALDRERIAAFALLKRRRDDAEAELNRLSLVERWILVLLRILPLITIGLSAYLILLGVSEKLPSGIGLAFLWCIVCPAFTLILFGFSARSRSAIMFGSVVLAGCCGIWIFQLSLPPIDVGSIQPLRVRLANNAGRQVCDLLAADVAAWGYPRSNNQSYCYSRLPSDAHFLINWSRSDDLYTFCRQVDSLFPDAIQNSCLSRADEVRQDVQRLVANSLSTGFTVRPHQIDELDSRVALIAISLVVLQILLYPAILVSTYRKESSWQVPVRRVWAELIDVCVTLALSLAFHLPTYLIKMLQKPGLIVNWFSEYWWHALAGIAFYLVVSSLLLRFTGATPGSFVAGMRTRTAKDGRPSLERALGRQAVLAVWTYLNIFGGMPSLLITPLYVWMNRNHQLLYDSLLRLKTDPREQRQEPSERIAASA